MFTHCQGREWGAGVHTRLTFESWSCRQAPKVGRGWIYSAVVWLMTLCSRARTLTQTFFFLGSVTSFPWSFPAFTQPAFHQALEEATRASCHPPRSCSYMTEKQLPYLLLVLVFPAFLPMADLHPDAGGSFPVLLAVSVWTPSILNWHFRSCSLSEDWLWIKSQVLIFQQFFSKLNRFVYHLCSSSAHVEWWWLVGKHWAKQKSDSQVHLHSKEGTIQTRRLENHGSPCLV